MVSCFILKLYLDFPKGQILRTLEESKEGIN